MSKKQIRQKEKFQLVKFSLTNSRYEAYDKSELKSNFRRNTKGLDDEGEIYANLNFLSNDQKIKKETFAKIHERIHFIKGFFLEFVEEDPDIKYIQSLYFLDIHNLVKMLVRVL